MYVGFFDEENRDVIELFRLGIKLILVLMVMVEVGMIIFLL